MAFPVTSVTLNQNTITAALFNMIISQRVFDSKVASTELADRFKVDGTMYGDTKLYYSFDIGALEDWTNDSEAANLLALNRNKSGKVQSITMGIYKMIWITTDHYLSKQAWDHEGVFGEYIDFLTSSMRKIKKVYDRSLINNKLGTMEPATEACDITVTSPKGATTEETNRLQAQTLAARLVVLKTDLEDNSRAFNALDYLRSYSEDGLIAVWNVEQHVKLTKLDLPTIFHHEINATGGFKEYDLPAKWFGEVGTTALTLPTSEPTSVTNRIMESGWYDVSGTTMTLVSKPTSTSVFLWSGDPVPYTGQIYKDYVRDISVTVVSTKLASGMYYTVDDEIAFVLIHTSALPYMSGFEVGTEFFNQRSLTKTNYLIFGHNNLEFLEEYPRIRVKLNVATS